MNIKIEVNSSLFLKDPTKSQVGKEIVSEGITLLKELGFEAFTFKKLAQIIGSTEATCYRYFENKHSFLLYLINWYWGIVEYRLMIATANIDEPQLKLTQAIHVLTGLPDAEEKGYIKEETELKRIIIQESAKVYHTKMVDEDNQFGGFLVYKRIVSTVAEMVKTVNPSFPYPEMLISTLIENANEQRFFSEHLPRLTNKSEDKDAVEAFSQLIMEKVLQ